MLLVRDEDYRGWHIRTHCRENKPPGWRSGDAVPCVGHGFIESRTAQQCDHGAARIDIHSIPAEGTLPFTAWPEAHAYLIAESKKLINRLLDVSGEGGAEPAARRLGQLIALPRRAVG